MSDIVFVKSFHAEQAGTSPTAPRDHLHIAAAAATFISPRRLPVLFWLIFLRHNDIMDERERASLAGARGRDLPRVLGAGHSGDSAASMPPLARPPPGLDRPHGPLAEFLPHLQRRGPLPFWMLVAAWSKQ